MIVAIVTVLVMLSFLVIIHELGHFTMARRAGILVREFGIGFPPRLAKIRRGKTDYSINALPLGGFVSLKGEDEKEKGKDSYATQNTWVKTKVLLAGVTVNFAFAYILLTLLLIVGIADVFPFSMPDSGLLKQNYKGNVHVRIVDISEGSAAQNAHLATGDTVVTINGKPIHSQSDLRATTKELAGQSVVIEYTRNDITSTVTTTLGTSADKGYLGVVSTDEKKIQYPWYIAPIAGFVACLKLAWATLAAFGGFIAGLLTRHQVSESVAGPIGITAAIPRVRQFGFDYILLLMAQISISLAVVNSLPIPPLDGGKAVLVWLRRAGITVSKKVEQRVAIAGFVALIALVIIVSVSDVARLR